MKGGREVAGTGCMVLASEGDVLMVVWSVGKLG